MRFSIIIPVYNVEKYVSQCIDSVLHQTYPDFEIILVDDGSTDNSPQICDDYADKDTRIKTVHKINGGSSSARNAGIRNAVGDYIMFMDSDDFWDKADALHNLNKQLTAEKPDVICFGYKEHVEGKGHNGKGLDFLGFDISNKEKNVILTEMFSKGLYVSSAWCKAVKSSIIFNNDLYFKEGITSEDIDWSGRLLKCINSIAVYPESFYNYRQRSDSIVHTIRYENLRMLSDNIICCVEFGEDIQDDEFKSLYYNYVSYQYITFLKVALLCENDMRTKPLADKMKVYRWLLKYHLNRKVRIVYFADKFLGYSLMNKLLKLYS